VDALLIDPLNAQSSADAIRRVFADPVLRERLAAAGRKRVREFSWSRVIDRYESLLSSSPIPR
jgi:glycosyltransferase involved in cell wall biosynthesis